MQKHIAPRFGDVENADRQAIKALRPRQPRPDRRTSFRGRVKQNSHVDLLAPSAVFPAKSGNPEPRGQSGCPWAPASAGATIDYQDLTSLVTGRLLRGPPADQPPMMPENMPASPPARTIIIPPGRNLLTVLPASDCGPPSSMPLAPATKSAPGISHSR